MIRLDPETVLSLHRTMTEQTGGDPGLRDRGLLESALASPYQSFGGAALYPTVEEKAARLGFALISNHAFVDGNKRIGLLSLLVFLSLSGKRVAVSDEELIRVTLAVAAGSMGYEELLRWVRSIVS